VRRAPVVLAATAAGLAATLGFSPHSKAPAATAVTTTTAASPPEFSSSTKTVTSDAVSTQYGNVQLKVTISGGKITGIQALQLPSQDPKSVEIASYAAPILRQRAVSAQSASIDVVSGATYTSVGYMLALQSALDNAGFQTGNSAAG
jgi:uncharacterized protein with FMN-binding domain